MAFKRLAPCTCFTPWHHLHWCERKKQQYETDKRIKEKLENMPTLEELMGGSGEKRPKVANLKVVGEFVKGVITDIQTDAPVFGWDSSNNRIGFQKFWVDGKPKGVAKDEAERAGLNPVHQIMITVETNDGLQRIPINSKDERDGFKQAVINAGGSIDVGDILGKKLIAREGNRKTHEIKLIKQGS